MYVFPVTYIRLIIDDGDHYETEPPTDNVLFSLGKRNSEGIRLTNSDSDGFRVVRDPISSILKNKRPIRKTTQLEGVHFLNICIFILGRDPGNKRSLFDPQSNDKPSCSGYASTNTLFTLETEPPCYNENYLNFYEGII